MNNFNEKINSSNLCVEITLPTKAPELVKEELVCENRSKIVSTSDNGQIALCNLSSINLIQYLELTEEQKEESLYNLLRASDNLLDYAYYPAKEGEFFNKSYRAIGVGVTNLAQLLALKGLKFGSEKALKYQNDVMESIYYYLMKANIRLASERGRFGKFFKTKHSKGILSHDLYNGPYKFKENYNWDEIREDMVSIGTRFSTVMAIAPTATSGLILKSTEGIEPVRQLVTMKTGTYNCKQLVPDLKRLRGDYELAWDIDPLDMIKMASVRQRWVDQSQSFSLYYKDRNESAYEVLKDILTAEKYGLKTLYYAHSPKEDEEEICESCAA
jgi:ribonucleoside-diphosphate reductase alpha chain